MTKVSISLPATLRACRDSIALHLILRKEISGKVTFRQPVKEVWLTNMNEERREKLKVGDDNSVSIEFGHKRIVTCEVVFD